MHALECQGRWKEKNDIACIFQPCKIFCILKRKKKSNEKLANRIENLMKISLWQSDRKSLHLLCNICDVSTRKLNKENIQKCIQDRPK